MLLKMPEWIVVSLAETWIEIPCGPLMFTVVGVVSLAETWIEIAKAKSAATAGI